MVNKKMLEDSQFGVAAARKRITSLVDTNMALSERFGSP